MRSRVGSLLLFTCTLSVFDPGIGLVRKSRAESASSLEYDADRRMDRGEYQLGKDMYKRAIQKDPKNEFLWIKYDLAHERYLRSINRISRRPPISADTPSSKTGASQEAEPSPSSDDPTKPSEESSPGTDPSPSASPSESPSPEPTPSPTPTPSEAPPYRSPDELIYLDRPVRSGDTTPVDGAEDSGRPITIKTPLYEISEIRFVMDAQGNLHVQGKVKNLSDRDYRNPKVWVALYDKLGLQLALNPGKVGQGSALLYRGDSAEFDASFYKFTTTVGAYKIFMHP